MPKIVILDDLAVEDTAMLQALYSRSSASVTEHIEKVKKTGSGKFMATYYCAYSHQSIADGASTNIFIENVSMLVAKSVQDWPLYSGQELSSRYVDLRSMGYTNPHPENPECAAIMEDWLKFYNEMQDPLKEHFYKKYPIMPGEKPPIYEKAVMARVFDTLRSFLPSGMRTNFSWHTNLRQAHDHLVLLRYHPLQEVRDIAAEIHRGLKEKYENSFCHKEYPEQEAYREWCTREYNYHRIPAPPNGVDFTASTNIDWHQMQAECAEIIAKRPIKTNLPNWLADYGSVTFKFLLDFGSFRDIQRHRNGVCRMPLLTTEYGFNQWYLDEMSEEVREKAVELIARQCERIRVLKETGGISDEDLQYLIPMGFNVSCQVTYGLPATLYTMELRSGTLVHPTLRIVAHKMHEALMAMFPGITLHTDLATTKWDIRRGTQDIVAKNPNTNN